MTDLDIDAGAGTIAKLFTEYRTGRAARDDTITQLLAFLREATQGIDLTADDQKKVEVYALTLLRRVETDELDSDSAAADLCELRRAAEVNDPSFMQLIEVPND